MSTTNTNGHTNGAPPASGTRKRTTSSTPSNGSTPSINTTSQNLPPSRRSKPLKSVSPPLSSFSFNKFIYVLVSLTLLLSSFYGYRMVQHKNEVGGWWNLVRGKGPVPGATPHAATWGSKAHEKRPSEESVEDRINGLANALGMPSSDLARAVAAAVRQYVPPASLSSVAAKETGEAVKVLLSEEAVINDGTGHPIHVGEAGAGAPAAKAGGVFGNVVGGVESFVGMDEP